MSDVPLITGVSSLDLLTEAGLDPTSALDVDNRPFFWQQIERIRAALAICDRLAPIKVWKFTIDNTAFKALPTTPVVLAPAPGSGKRLKALGCTLRMNASAGAYTNINATYSALAIYWQGDFSQWALDGVVNDSTEASATLDRLSGFAGSAATNWTDLPTYVDIFTTNRWTIAPLIPSTITENKALAIAIDNNGSGNLTAGHINNVLSGWLYYTEQAFP